MTEEVEEQAVWTLNYLGTEDSIPTYLTVDIDKDSVPSLMSHLLDQSNSVDGEVKLKAFGLVRLIATAGMVSGDFDYGHYVAVIEDEDKLKQSIFNPLVLCNTLDDEFIYIPEPEVVSEVAIVEFKRNVANIVEDEVVDPLTEAVEVDIEASNLIRNTDGDGVDCCIVQEDAVEDQYPLDDTGDASAVEVNE